MSFPNISFILHKPQLSENIGACARAIKNFNFKKLVVINPKPIFPNEKVSFEVNFVNSVRDVYKFQGTCYKEDVKVCEAEFSAMITYK